MSQIDLARLGQRMAAFGPACLMGTTKALRNGCSWLLVVCVMLASADLAWGQMPEPAGPALPSLPGAVTQPPDWIGNTAPFDVRAFFSAPPPEKNAAPRYLDALFEFSSEMAICFPEGPERQQRTQAAQERLKKLGGISTALRKNAREVSTEAIDALLALYDEGFIKLAKAQERPQCVFQTALGYTARVPHTDGARGVGRVIAIRVRRERENGSLIRAINDLSRLLRLSRDLLPQGGLIADYTSISLDRMAIEDVVLPMLADPALTVQHCDRIQALLAEHDTRSIDVYSEGLRAEYLACRATLRDLVLHQDRLRLELKDFGVNVGPSITAELAEPQLFSMLAGNGPFPQPTAAQRLRNQAARLMSLRNIQDLDVRMARIKPEEMTRQVEKLNAFFRDRLALSTIPYAARIKQTAGPSPAFSSLDFYTRVTRGLIPADNWAIRVIARSQALRRDAQGLTAVRRWQIRHDSALPPSLADATKETGLPAVPIDPYTGGPIRLAINDGQPVVYCVGEDGRDDHGHNEATLGHDLGDVLLRMPRR